MKAAVCLFAVLAGLGGMPFDAAAQAGEAAPAPSPPPGAATATAVAPAALPQPRATLPRKGRARYALMRGEDGFVIAEVVHTWERDGRSYRMQSVTETTGLAALIKQARDVQASQGEVTAAGLKPHEFRHQRVKGQDTATFDWARHVVVYDGREERIIAGTQDMLSLYSQLVLLGVTRGAVDIPIATGRKLETYRFEVLGEETVTLPAGKRRAWRLKTRSSGNDTTEVWIAPEQRGVPVKIRLTDRKGTIYDQVLLDADIQDAR